MMYPSTQVDPLENPDWIPAPAEWHKERKVTTYQQFQANKQASTNSSYNLFFKL